MTIKDFEKELKKIDVDINIRLNPNADDIAGVYWKDAYLGVAVPPLEIHETFSPKYVDSKGYPYRTIEMATELVKGKLKKFQDPEIYKIMTTKE